MLEQLLVKEIEEQSKNIISKMQNEYFCDPFDFLSKIKQKNYSYWEKMKDGWEGDGGRFQNAMFHVTAQVKIRQYMNKERML